MHTMTRGESATLPHSPDTRSAFTGPPLARGPSVPGIVFALATTLVLAMALAAAGCGGMAVGDPPAAPGRTGEEALTPGETVAGRAPGAITVDRGRAVYLEYCAGCHGESGQGNGPASSFLNPKPRDFTSGEFKFAAVASGDLPNDEDLLRTLDRGLSGSSMPSWKLLPDADKRAVIAYLKTFLPAGQKWQPGTPITTSPDPFADGGMTAVTEAIDRGRFVYHVSVACWQCHRAYVTQKELDALAAAEPYPTRLRENADRPEATEDNWGNVLLPTDFTRQRLKSGSSLPDLYRTIASGIGGTAMPTWKGSLDERDLWALAYYVKSLADRRWQRPQSMPTPPFAPVAATAAGSAAASTGPGTGVPYRDAVAQLDANDRENDQR